VRALAIAATGMNAQQTNLDVISNNIANINTTGYKRSRAEFTDLLYQNERPAGVPTRGTENIVPEGAQVGLGVRLAAVRNLHIQGALTQTGNSLDVAINGRGWFQVQGSNSEVFYTRAGAFNKNASGQIVTTDGYVVQPSITIPNNATKVTIDQNGIVYAETGSGAAVTQSQIGQLTIASFVNEAGLEPAGDNLYRESVASGAATLGLAGDTGGTGTIQQGYLENSNVDPVKEITELITAQRAYEMNSKVIQAANDMYSTLTKSTM
jgi:flagellar basal-body rod protein FlgG